MTAADYVTLTGHLERMVRLPRPPRLDRLRLRVLLEVREAIPRLP